MITAVSAKGVTLCYTDEDGAKTHHNETLRVSQVTLDRVKIVS